MSLFRHDEGQNLYDGIAGRSGGPALTMGDYFGTRVTRRQVCFKTRGPVMGSRRPKKLSLCLLPRGVFRITLRRCIKLDHREQNLAEDIKSCGNIFTIFTMYHLSDVGLSSNR